MKKIVLIVFSIIALASCKDVDYTPTGVGDALIIVKVTETDTLFGLGLHAFSYNNFSNVYVYHSDNPNNKYTLKSVEGYMNDLYYESSSANFTHDLPLIGEYIFLAGFPGGESITFTDELFDNYILPPKITTCVFNNSRERIDVSWEKREDTDIYSVKLYDMDRNILFISSPLDNESVSFSIGTSSETWIENKAPESGKNYIVEVSSYKNETNGNDLNIQSVGRIEKIVMWQ